MNLFKSKYITNLFFVLILFYLSYHSLFGKFNIQSHLISQFELKLFENYQKNITTKIQDIEKDLFALYAEKKDMNDELSKRFNPGPQQGEIVIKID